MMGTGAGNDDGRTRTLKIRKQTAWADDDDYHMGAKWDTVLFYDRPIATAANDDGVIVNGRHACTPSFVPNLSILAYALQVRSVAIPRGARIIVFPIK